jgi:tetratricopeptide (TPR) repeat protein
LSASIADAAAMVVLIGPDWLGCKDSRGHVRLENPNDFVRLEVATALRRNVRVIPVLMDNSRMPASEQLPEDLAPLGRRQALEVSNLRFNQDAARLIEVLEKLPAFDNQTNNSVVAERVAAVEGVEPEREDAGQATVEHDHSADPGASGKASRPPWVFRSAVAFAVACVCGYTIYVKTADRDPANGPVSQVQSATNDATVLAGDTTTKLEAAKQYLERREYATAEDIYKKVLAAEPNNADALTGLAAALYREDKIEESAAILDRLPKN